jgi:tRNA-2-methylthio-N6-dimethylallyladenosine synthase
LRKVRPDISISSDFIIGFPGETEQDFEQTMQLIDAVNFDKSFSFIYSQRPGTPAANYPDDVALAVKKQRLETLQKTIDASTEIISKAMIGSVQKVLVENKAKKDDNLFGRTENMRNTHFAGDVSLIGQIVDVKITNARGNSLMGELL